MDQTTKHELQPEGCEFPVCDCSGYCTARPQANPFAIFPGANDKLHAAEAMAGQAFQELAQYKHLFDQALLDQIVLDAMDAAWSTLLHEVKVPPFHEDDVRSVLRELAATILHPHLATIEALQREKALFLADWGTPD